MWHSAGVSAPAAAAPSGVVTFLFTRQHRGGRLRPGQHPGPQYLPPRRVPIQTRILSPMQQLAEKGNQ